jgi:hypothetical protein
MSKITVENTDITVLNLDNHDYICLTDMAGAKENDARAADVIKNWLRNRYTIEFLGTWEMIHNPDFKVVDFDHFRKEAGLPTFVLSCSEWIEERNQLICLSNMENLNAVFINDNIPQPERLEKLNKIAIQQMKVLEDVDGRKLFIEERK